MTATEIIAEIGALPPEEKLRVIRFASRLERQAPLSGPELTALAEKLANAQDPREAAALREQIMTGFYGKE